MVKDHPLYQQGLAHLQAGQWQEAIACLEDLEREVPDSELLRRMLAEAYYKAKRDATARVRAKSWVFPWRSIAFRILMVLGIGAIAIQGVLIISRTIAPIVAQAQTARRRTRLLAEANAYLAAGDLDTAEARYHDILAEVPDHNEALQALAQVEEQRGTLDLYLQGVRLQEAGDYEAALDRFTELSVLSSQYRDVNQRIMAIGRQEELDLLLAEAEADYHAGLALDAASKYEQIRKLNVTYRRDVIVSRLSQLYVELGLELVEADPPASEAIPQALEYFKAALALQPRSIEAALEHRLAAVYLEGQARYDQGLWDAAIGRLRAVYDQRPAYLGGRVTDLLYDAYIRSGDRHGDADDPGMAYEQYRKAADLSVADPSLARNRMVTIAPLLTPTPTPTVTPTPTNTPTQTPIPTPTPISTWTPMPTGTAIPTRTPTPTPMPLSAFRHQIVFYSSDEDNPGYWVIDPNGQNRQYLGQSRSLRLQFEALVEQAQFSPDGRHRLFAGTAQGADSAQIFMTQPRHPEYGELPPLQLTQLTGLCYHPVWSPDGSRIAFVSQEAGSDDIWTINADGTGARNLTENIWQWDKHPSWSPDSRRIAFWSNRTGVKQIHVMDADGRNARNISNTQWDEYDPIWIR